MRVFFAAVFFLSAGEARAAASGLEALSGEELFTTVFDASMGLGPYYNDVSCVSCHSIPAIGGGGDVAHAAAMGPGDGDVVPLPKHTVPGYPPKTARLRGPAGRRVPPPLYGLGLFAALSDEQISPACGAAPADGVRGHANRRKRGGQYKVGRFGSKAQEATLRDFITFALAGEMGVTTASMLERGYTDGSGRRTPELADPELDRLVAFVEKLPPPRPRTSRPIGRRLFAQAGCAVCHQEATGGKVAGAYTDLCLHRMGDKLADGVFDQEAGPDEFRTPPLWGLADRPVLLHDGRASTIEQAIGAHGGEAAASLRRYSALSEADKRALTAFLSSL